MIILISYDLNEHENIEDYEKLIDVIRSTAGEGNYAKPLYSQWFVDTNLSIHQWNNILKDATDNNDSRMIIEIVRRPVGKYNKPAITWINERLTEYY